ncbi:MAG TPA: GNAT family N-acetyltransferase [Verrucomicrobiales bacterium]|nr:GNAT family N-acetyltransferase [Verrucomicrobiales bacterium]
MGEDIGITAVTGEAIRPFIPDAARLRIAVFREYPYLYDGSMAYEEKYLRTYSESPGSLFVIAHDGDRVIGVSTAMPLQHETEEVQRPFREAGVPVQEVFYFGESVLEAEYRGQGIGVRFMQEREAHARRTPGIRKVAFCAVDRPPDHPLRSADYVSLDAFWQRRGFTKTALTTEFSWKETGEAEESLKRMQFWWKGLE